MLCTTVAQMSRTHAPKWPLMRGLLAQGGLSPTHRRLAETSYIPERTISKIIEDLGPEGQLVGGHPLRFGPSMGLAVGVSLGMESMRAGLVDANGDIHCAKEAGRDSTQLAASPRALLPRIRSLVADVLAEGMSRDELRAPDTESLRLLGVSVAWPAPIDRSKRVLGKALRDKTWQTRDPDTRKVKSLRKFLAEYLGPPFDSNRCHALNDVSAAALGVSFRNARAQAMKDDDDDQWRVELVVRVGGSLGAATIMNAPHCKNRLSFVDSKLIEGTNGLAGELGHLPIGRKFVEELNETRDIDDLADIDYDAWKCSCGRPHHLEAYASGAALVRRLDESGYSLPPEGNGAAHLLEELAGGDPDPGLVHALTDIGRILSRALTGPILMLDPYRITITGSLASEYLVEGMRRERDKWANAIDDKVVIGFTEEDDAAYIEVLGTALAVIRRYIYRYHLDEKQELETFDFDKDDLDRLQKLASKKARAPKATTA